MIEEILTDHRERKAAAPVGDFLKFGVHALLSARPLHNHLGKTGAAELRGFPPVAAVAPAPSALSFHAFQ